MKALIYGNGEFQNLGCEAIARGVSEILAQVKSCDISMATQLPDMDSGTIASLNANVVKLSRGREGLDNILCEGLIRIGMGKYVTIIPHSNAQKIAKNMDISFAVGGDNYCYKGNERYYRLNKGIRKSSKMNVFWGCSIEPLMIDRQMIADLDGYDCIYARESITYEALCSVGLTRVKLCVDPAFQMKPDYSEIPEHFSTKSGGWLGVNLSPLIYKYATVPETVQKSVIAVLQRVLDSTDFNICFIPHVYGQGNDIFINRDIASQLKNTKDRVMCFEKRINAAQMKGIISYFDAFICARTHASIAAYSSCVPTFVLGYSVKAKGIAKDIFGTFNSHVIPVQELNDVDIFCRQIEKFLEQIRNERDVLKKVIPGYSRKANVILESIRNA